MFLGITTNIFISIEKNATSAKKKKIGHIGMMTCVWIGIIAILALLLLVIGWIWYYICGGFFIECADSFFWKAVWGLFTLIPLGFILGFIAIIFGYNPK